MLIGAVASKFMIEPAEVPSFVRDVGGEFEPAVGMPMARRKSKAHPPSFSEAPIRETGDIFGNGEGLGADGVDEFVGKGEIGEGI